MNINFDYEGARNAGYSDEEISKYLSERKPDKSLDSINQKLLKNKPNFDFQGALDAGYTPNEINEYLKKSQPEKTLLEKSARIGGQYGLGILQGTPAGIAYDISTLPLASPEAQNITYRETLSDDLERLMEQKSMGQWDDQDQALYESIIEQIKDPRKSIQNVQTADVGIRGLAEKATGIDFEPENYLEQAANWAGMIKDPKNISKLANFGVNPKDAFKAIMPTGTEVARGLGAGSALQIAKDGNFGPIGTMASVVIGDVLGGGAAGFAKSTKDFIQNPKEFLAKKSMAFTPKDKIELQKKLVKDFRDSNIQADFGTLTDSNLAKWTQSRLIQSGFTGKALDEFKDQLTNQIKNEYKALAESIGEARFSTAHEAGNLVKSEIKAIRDSELNNSRKLYEDALKSLDKGAKVDSTRLASTLNKIERELKPGSLKSVQQSSVLRTLEDLKKDIFDGKKIKPANVIDLINNKIALGDIINYEIQGGTKQLLKSLVSELDRSIISYGNQNNKFAGKYINANRNFSEHARTFRNKSAEQLMKMEDPSKILEKMNTVQGIRTLEKILEKTPNGKKVFNDLKRLKLDRVIGDNLVDSTTQQVKLGTFSKLLEKGKNRDAIKEILPKETFKRLEKLQKNSGKLADAANKFFNASKSGTTTADAAILVKGLTDIANILSGNPWPLLKFGGGLLAARKLSNLLADTEFLRLVEDVILKSEKGSRSEFINSVIKLKPYLIEASRINENEYNQQQNKKL